jgi:hypothetical protein
MFSMIAESGKNPSHDQHMASTKRLTLVLLYLGTGHDSVGQSTDAAIVPALVGHPTRLISLACSSLTYVRVLSQ